MVKYKVVMKEIKSMKKAMRRMAGGYVSINGCTGVVMEEWRVWMEELELCMVD